MGSIVQGAQREDESQVQTDPVGTQRVARKLLVETERCLPRCFSVPPGEFEVTPLTLKSLCATPPRFARYT